MTNINFPKTNAVKCVFSYRQNRPSEGTSSGMYDEYDHLRKADTLKEYWYRVPKYLEDQLCVGQPVLVHCATGYQVCEIVEINALYPKDVSQLAPVVATIDLYKYFEEKQKERDLANMKNVLDDMVAQLQKSAMYDMLAEKNPGFAQLLNAYKEKGGTF